MNWDEDSKPKTKRSVGRPVESPFPSFETEEEFVQRAQAMINLYYHPAGPNTRKDFVFRPGCALSKTEFWSYVYVYYTNTQGMKRNVLGFLNAILQHFDPQVVSDRTSLTKRIGLMENIRAHLKYIAYDDEGDDADKQVKKRKQYQFVVRRWQECLDQNT